MAKKLKYVLVKYIRNKYSAYVILNSANQYTDISL